MSSQNQQELFGTDGIRSITGKYPLDQASLIKIGFCLGELWKGAKILVGRDTRESGENIVNQLAYGLGKSTNLYCCEVIPTPGLSYVIGHSDYDYGIMITASHNPFVYNGLKLFQGNGEKTPGMLERRIEEIFFSTKLNNESEFYQEKIKQTNRVQTESQEKYEQFLVDNASELNTFKLKIVLDCANGATYRIAPELFKELDLDPIVINNQPDGRNINEKCGSTDLSHLKETVILNNADLGIAFDGDGDRVIFVDRDGFMLDGDYTLFLISNYLQKKNQLYNSMVVGTVMSNLGLEEALSQRGIELVRTSVGDKNVYREMKEINSILGGEQSGHIILKNLQKTGDGILTALFFLKALAYFRLKVEEVKKEIIPFPQAYRNIALKEKKSLSEWDELNELVAHFNNQYGKNSRVVIRYSGTEPLIRVMMESKYQNIIDENFDLFVNLIESTIGELNEIGS
ncbi:MAG: phosphoglucosamine mutase [Candidatus Aminicenantes bacterium]|nr:phosphoglucosamine mutase [Candidatus Aminicenantes bacterium]